MNAATRPDAAGRLFQRLANEADAYAARVGGGEATAYCHQIGALHGAYRGVADELAKFVGTPDPNCCHLKTLIGASPVVVEYEMDPDDGVVLGGCLINGEWTTADDLPSSITDKWIEQAAEQEMEVARQQRESCQADAAWFAQEAA